MQQRKRPWQKVKSPISNLEDTFDIQIRAFRLPKARRQYRFHPKRRWQFDFAWPELKIAVEIEGGTYLQGRHVRPEGFRNDCKKYNEAALLGWTVLRGDTLMVKEAILLDTVREAIKNRKLEVV